MSLSPSLHITNGSYRLPIAKTKSLCVALLGPGGVGGTLLEQLRTVLPQQLARSHFGAGTVLVPEVKAIVNSRRMLLAASGLDLQQAATVLNDLGEAPDFDKFSRFLARHDGPVAVVDTTASEAIAARHREWLARGYHVLTANKLAGSAATPAYQALRAAETSGGGRYHCETTVGAGLPLIGVLEDFVRTGDEVLKVEGILSGTLSHLCCQLQQGKPFSQAIRSLHAAGYTEPDPRIDLSGTDVARKLVILGRIAGFTLDLDAVTREGAVALPADDRRSNDDFLATCGQYDDELSRRSAAAAARGCVLRYVATLAKGEGARVGLSEVPQDHPLAHIRAGDNLVQITTSRYASNPLVIQGPGAGREVTASGLLADLLRIGTSQR